MSADIENVNTFIHPAMGGLLVLPLTIIVSIVLLYQQIGCALQSSITCSCMRLYIPACRALHSLLAMCCREYRPLHLYASCPWPSHPKRRIRGTDIVGTFLCAPRLSLRGYDLIVHRRHLGEAFFECISFHQNASLKVGNM